MDLQVGRDGEGGVLRGKGGRGVWFACLRFLGVWLEDDVFVAT